MNSFPKVDSTVLNTARTSQHTRDCPQVSYTGATTNRRLSLNSEVLPSIPPADQPPKMRSDIASRTLTQAENISEVAEFGQKAPVTVESSGEPAVRPEDVLDRQIRERLQSLKDKYKEQFSFIKDKSTTSNYCKPGSWAPLIVETAGELGQFINEYKTDKWHFLFNLKDPQWQQHFDQSTMVAFQYEYLSEAKQSKMKLPKTITQLVGSQDSVDVINKYKGNHNSEQFRYEYLTTMDDGKRVSRVADDLGLIIEGIEPDPDHYEKEHSCSNSWEDCKWSYPLFNVIYRVSPNPEVYPASTSS